MRLPAVERGHRFRERLIIEITGRISGATSDIVRTLLHRPEFLGRPLGAITNRAMREPSEWSVAERELFAAFVSTQNRCEFCIACHTEYACQAGDRGVVERTLRDGASGNERHDAALDFLAAFARGQDAISADHVDRLRAAGVGDRAIRDLAQIGFSFCLINRVADALQFRVLSREQFARGWPTMRDRGYTV